MTRSTLSHTHTLNSVVVSSLPPPLSLESRPRKVRRRRRRRRSKKWEKWRRNSCLGKEIKLKASIPRLVSSVSSNHSSIHYHVKIPKSPCVHILNEEENEAQDLNPTSIPSVSS